MLTDSDARNVIIKQLDKNVFTNASAGAGKTTSLTLRIVSLIKSGVDISKICTITYTKAAANEFYERLQKLLSDDSSKECKEALKNIDLCFMGTIDSFTNKIVNEHPIEMGIPAGTQVVEGERLDTYINDLYIRIMNGEYDSKYNLEELRREFISCVSKPRANFLEGLKIVLDKRNARLEYPQVSKIDENDITEIKWYASSFLDLIDKDELLSSSSANASFKAAINYRYKVLNYFNTSISEAAKMLKKISGIGISAKKCEKLEIASSLSSHLTMPQGRATNYGYDRLNEILERLNKYRLYICAKLFDIAKQIATEELNKQGLLTYAGFLITLRDVLRDDIAHEHKIIDHIANKYQYFLLDESQDTSPLQTQIFFYINARNYDVDWTKCNPKPGSIFIVGDSKQSIYRFTGADVEAYLDTEKLFNEINDLSEINKYDNIKVTLTKNYRSTRTLREWFNDDFSELLGSDGNPVHPDIDLTDPFKENEKYATLNGVYRFESSIQKEENAKRVVKIIKSIVNNDEYKILAQREKNIRTVDYKDIMIITKSKAFNALMEELDREDIPFYAEGRTLFENDEALNTIKTLFKAIVCPSNVQYVYEALLSSYCNLNDNDIVDIINNQKLDIVNYEINKNINNKANKELAKLNKLFKETKDLSYTGRFEYLLNKINIFESIKIENLDLAYYALEILRNNEKDGLLITDEKAIEFIDNISSDNNDYERSLKLNNERNAVRLANVHKVKGLQAPVVILSLQRDSEKSPTSRLLFKGEEVFEPYSLCDITIDAESKESEKIALNAEKKRLEYVAATRAESALIIGYCKKQDGCLRASIWNDLLINSEVKEFDFKENEASINNCKEVTVDELYQNNSCINASSFDKSYNVVSPSKLEVKKLATEPLDNDHYVSKMNKEHDAAKVGTIIHRMMELVANSRNKMDIRDIIKIIDNEYNIDDDLMSLISITYGVIVSGGFKQNSDYSDDILKEILNAKTVMCEVPFSYMNGDNLYSGFMDLVYEDSNSNWHIIDYKTTYEMNIDVLGEKYKEQLENYKQALQKIMNISAEAHIYHIDVK